MRFCILALCLLGTMVSSSSGFRFAKRNLPEEDASTSGEDAAATTDTTAAATTDAATDAATTAGDMGGMAKPDANKYVPYVPDDDPYDINAIDQENLGTVGKLLTGVGDLVRGLCKGLEPSVTSLYTVIIPTVRIVLAGGKIKVCRPQSRLEVVVWFVKEFVNVQLSADLAIAQIPLCVPREEPASLQKWAITYEVPKEMANDKSMEELMENPEGAIQNAGDGEAPAGGEGEGAGEGTGEGAPVPPTGEDGGEGEGAGESPTSELEV